jgi:hypothetical protein
MSALTEASFAIWINARADTGAVLERGDKIRKVELAARPVWPPSSDRKGLVAPPTRDELYRFVAKRQFSVYELAARPEWPPSGDRKGLVALRTCEEL